MVVSLTISSPRPLTRPGRFDSVISPLTYEPAGMTTRPSIMTGKRVSKYTGSPARALRVDIALCRTSGMCVPVGTSILAADAEGVDVAEGAGFAEATPAAALAGAGPDCWAMGPA